MPNSNSAIAYWGRLAFTRGGYDGLQAEAPAEPADPRPAMPGFRAGFDDFLRAQYARAVEQAREFVEFVDLEPGSAVIELGAGSGRITFDGGLAERVGPGGQVLATDPSVSQLNALVRRARDLGVSWLRALQARAEDLPLIDGTADAVLGALFLHFTDQDRAFAEMARVVRPGGTVAVTTGLAFTWPDAWWEILEPVRRELEHRGLPYRHFFPAADELLARVTANGLRIERTQPFGPEIAEFPSVDLAIAFWRQVGLVPLSLRGVPASQHVALQEAFEERARDVFARTTPDQRRGAVDWLTIVARRPA